MSLFDPFQVQTKYLRKSHNGQVNRVKLIKPFGKAYSQEEIEEIKNLLINQGFAIIPLGNLPTTYNRKICNVYTFNDVPNVIVPDHSGTSMYLNLFIPNILQDYASIFNDHNNIVSSQINIGLLSIINPTMTLQQTPANGSIIGVGVTGSSLLRSFNSTYYGNFTGNDIAIYSYSNQTILDLSLSASQVVLVNVNLPTPYLNFIQSNNIQDLIDLSNLDFTNFNPSLFDYVRSAQDNSGVDVLVPHIYFSFFLDISVNYSY